ncbi:MAG TPA: ABC transporter permease [Thermomicrobiales bacterium]|nr:ABC transporter permease [Thermomicrobiales bacterium]
MTASAPALDSPSLQNDALSNTKPISPWVLNWRRLRRSRPALVGGAIFLFVSIIALLAPLIAPYGKNDIDLFNITAPASRAHWLGTDALGRDVLTRLMYGGRLSLLIGILSAVIAVVIGVIIGAISGFYGGLIDSILMRFVDVMLAFPSIFLLLIVAAMLNGITVPNVILFLSAFGWMWLARIIRGEFLSLKQREFIEAARMIGVPNSRIMFRHLVPNVTGPIIVALTLDIALYILAEATLSFLGFGVKPETPTWGNMLNEAQIYALTHPLLIITPGLTITIVVLAINFIGDGLRDAFDPKSGR